MIYLGKTFLLRIGVGISDRSGELCVVIRLGSRADDRAGWLTMPFAMAADTLHGKTRGTSNAALSLSKPQYRVENEIEVIPMTFPSSAKSPLLANEQQRKREIYSISAVVAA